jgi:hypothetical protein
MFNCKDCSGLLDFFNPPVCLPEQVVFVIICEEDHGVNILPILFIPGLLERVIQAMTGSFHPMAECLLVRTEFFQVEAKVVIAIRGQKEAYEEATWNMMSAILLPLFELLLRRANAPGKCADPGLDVLLLPCLELQEQVDRVVSPMPLQDIPLQVGQ